MKLLTRSSLYLGAALGVLMTCNALAAETAAPATKPLSAGDATRTTVTAKVEAIDPVKREVTLKGPLGDVVTFVVDERVKRLNEVSVGDEVTADYYVSWATELRAPTEAEKKNPLAVVEDTARAPAGTSPAGGTLRAFKFVATVTGIDLPAQSLTVQGPRGKSGSIRADNAENLKKLKVGDTIIVTYVEALAVSLQKAQAAKK